MVDQAAAGAEPTTGTEPAPAFPLPLEPESFGSSAREHERRRGQCPVGLVTMPSGDPAHLVVRYDDVAQLLRDRRVSRNLRYPGAPRMVREADPSDNPHALVNHDPPEHTRYRQVIQGVFSPSQQPAWTPVVRRIVGELLDRIEAQGPPADLVRDFATVLPIRVVCELLDVPAEDHQRFANWTGVFFAVDPATDEARLAAGHEFLAYLVAMIEQRRAEPRDGVVDLLIRARDAEDRLNEPELVQMIAALFIGGQENMASFLARGVFTLLRHRDQFDALREDPALVDGAVEEILRFDIPSEGAFLRVATEDVALGGGAIPKGRAVQVSLASANRDESHFADPHRFDIRREPNAHLSFGLGAHFCPGAPLARLELRTAISMITERFPKLDLAIAPHEARYAEGALIHPLLELPVTW
jgi:cytochrome P450